MLAIIQRHDKGVDFCDESSCMQRQGEGDQNSPEETEQRPYAKGSCSRSSRESRWALEFAVKGPCHVSGAPCHCLSRSGKVVIYAMPQVLVTRPVICTCSNLSQHIALCCKVSKLSQVLACRPHA